MKPVPFFSAVALILATVLGTGCVVRPIHERDNYCRYHDCHRDRDWR